MRDHEKILAVSEAADTRLPAWLLLLLVCPVGLLLLFSGVRRFTWASFFSPALLQILFGFALFGSGLTGFVLLCRAADSRVTVTERAVTGCDARKRPLYLPMESITEVREDGGGLRVSTLSGSYVFPRVKNSGEICGAIRRQLARRDREQSREPESRPAPPVSPADEIEKYKRLLDMGAITAEEYEAKKKQLLGL